MTEPPSRQAPPMTLKPPPRGKSQGPSFWQWAAIAAGIVVVLAIVAGGSGGGDKKKAADAPAVPFRATSAQARAYVAGQLANDPVDGGRVRKAVCRHGVCDVLYDTGDLAGIDVEQELLDQQRPIFRKLFSVRSVRTVFLAAFGEVQSIGGKTSTAEILEVLCTRRAADQIDWGNVDVDGIKALCDWTPMVKL